MLRTFFLVVFATFLASCSPSNNNSNNKIEIDKFTLIRQIEQTNHINVNAHIIPKAIYNLPTEDFIFKLSQKYNTFKDSISYTEREKINCTDWTAGATFFAKTLDSGVLFGEFGYFKDSGTGHAVNFTFILEAGRLKMVFFEPQTCQIVKLTDTEIGSCKYWRF